MSMSSGDRLCSIHLPKIPTKTRRMRYGVREALSEGRRLLKLRKGRIRIAEMFEDISHSHSPMYEYDASHRAGFLSIRGWRPNEGYVRPSPAPPGQSCEPGQGYMVRTVSI
jgi:hypothetical protein